MLRPITIYHFILLNPSDKENFAFIMKKSILFLLVLFLGSASLSAQQGVSLRNATAVRTTQAPKIDGKISDSVWQLATPLTDFIINSPDFGKPSRLATKVWILYDDAALYLAANLEDDPTLIRKQLTARDGEQRQDVDYFAAYFDTYNDNQNGFQFVVTSRNVQSDGRISPSAHNQFGPPSDYSWDAVWESNVQFTTTGWTVEIRIPYISLRFSKAVEQSWGINFQRFSRRLNESSYWNPINPNEAGFVNQFGDLTGISGIEPPLRLSILPYLTAGFRNTPTSKGVVKEFLRNGGVDLKWGVNESFTLDATLVPDFGQVISDNVILNLSPFEVRFQENRPFFTEGTELFNKAGLFYSRRIGLTPRGYWGVKNRVANDPNLRIIHNPGITQLINASKFSGRNNKNLGIAVFNAVSAPMSATIENIATGKRESIETEPLTNYNLLVLDQALKGRSSITFTNTNVVRSGIARDANVSALDFALFDKNNRYSLAGTARYSTVKSQDPYDGFTTWLSFRKISGKLQFSLSENVESDRYDPNDLGFLRAPNEINTMVNVSYNQFTPTKKLLSYRYSLRATNSYLYKPYRWREISIGASAFYYLKNFWDITFIYEAKPTWQNDFFELRTPGRFVRAMPWHYVGFVGSSDSRKRFYISAEGGYATTPAFSNAAFVRYEFSFRYRFNNWLSLTLYSEGSEDNGNVGFAFRREANGEPIIGWRNIFQQTTLLTGLLNFTPRMFLTLRARHYWSKVSYEKFYNVNPAGNWVDRSFIAGVDNNYNAYNLDVFYTWDFMYGSRLIVGWKNWMPLDYNIDGSRFQTYGKNLRQVLTSHQGKEATIRLIYFLDYQKLRRKQPH
ncbi:MAG: carbohydrate binding family 9 domain-containing protein [Bacteroidetes bacterium]|nr:carbohydrate binding family 9 domain-containing protein [Bacteroidota bacterium]